MGCGCKNAEGGCGCGSKEMNWESYDKPSFKKTMMADSRRPMECDFCGGTDEVGYVDDGRTLLVCEHCDVDGSNYPGWNEKTMMAESWGETDQATMEEFFGYNLDTSPDQRVAEMLDDDSIDLPSLEWYFQNSLNGQGDWMTANYGKDSVEEALARVQGRMGKTNKFGFQAEEPVVQEPDWIPQGDGRAIGQQDFAINLSPLHAESEKITSSQYTFNTYSNLAYEKEEIIKFLSSIGNSSFEVREKPMRRLNEIEEKMNSIEREVKFAESSGFKTFIKNMKKRVKTGEASAVIIEGNVGKNGLPKQSKMFQVGYKQDGFKPSKIQVIPKQTVPRGYNNAESRFDKLSNEIADEYEEKGMSPEKAQEVGDATAAKIGRAKYGKTGMRNMQKKGMRADMVGNPSPTFNEDITGQDGPSADPTNQTFEAMRTLAPSSADVSRARRDLKNSGYGDVIYDRYMVNRDGSSNKFYYTAVTEKDGKYYPMGAYGRIGYLSKLFNIYGKSEGPKASLSTMDAAYRQCSAKEKAKIKRGYVDYTLSMAESYRAESLSEIEGPTAEATTGGLHAPSSFAMTWEDGTGQSSASIPPNEIAWAEDVKGSEGAILGGVAVVGLFAVGLIAAMKFNPANKKKDDGAESKNAEKGCGCSKTVAKSETVRKHSEYSADRINPVEVEGQNDIHNAESISLPQPNAGPQTAHRQSNRPSLKLW